MLFGKAYTEVSGLLLPVVQESVWTSRSHRKFWFFSLFQDMGNACERAGDLSQNSGEGQLSAYSHPRRALVQTYGF